MIFVLLGFTMFLIGMFVGKIRILYRWIMMFLGLFIIFILPIIPWGGYEPPVLEEITLVSLNASEQGKYLFVSDKEEYSYKYEVNNTTNIPGEIYETDTISGKVKKFELPECKVPILKKYTFKAKGKFWWSLIVEDKFEYEFYLPDGSIVYE